MGILIVAAYFGFGGTRALWYHFSNNGLPSSLGEIFTTSILVAITEILIAAGVLFKKMWARHGALGATLYSLGNLIFLCIINPAPTILGLYYLAPIMVFFTGIGFPQMLVMVLVGVVMVFGFSMTILFLLMRKSYVADFLGADSLEGTTFFERSMISRDYLIALWVVLFFSLNHFQKWIPQSFYKEKEKKDFALLVKEVKDSDAYKKIQTEQDQRREASLYLNIEFSANEKKLYLQFSKTDRFDLSELYEYDLSNYKLTSLNVPKSFDLKQITPDRLFLVNEDRTQIFNLSTQKTIPLREFIGGILSDKEKGFTSLGFGPLRDTYLKYYTAKKSLILYDIIENKEIRSYPFEPQNPVQLTFYPFPSRNKGIITDNSATMSWIWEWTKNEPVLIPNLPSFIDMSFVADSDETGFFALKTNPYPKEKTSFMVRFNDLSITTFSIDGKPLAFSLKKDFLLYLSQEKVKKISLSNPTNETVIATSVQEGVQWNPSQNTLYYRDGKNLFYKDIITNNGGLIYSSSFPSQHGTLRVSKSGQLIAMTSGRFVQVFWKSEIGKPNPRFLQFEVKKK